MKIYHGTSARSLNAILAKGLAPRGKRSGNFGHTVESSPDAVYLTDTYPVYFAACASAGRKGAVVEIETDLLDQNLLNADEDALEQASRKRDELPPDWDIKQRTSYYRDKLVTTRWEWEQSISAMGTCCYMGAIPPGAITRAVLIDFKKNPRLLLTALDASISILNYKFCRDTYRQMTAWVFGDPLPEASDEFGSHAWLQLTGKPSYMSTREGIEFALIRSNADEVQNPISR